MHHIAVETDALNGGKVTLGAGVTVDDGCRCPVLPVLAFEKVINNPEDQHIDEEWHDEHDNNELHLRVPYWIEDEFTNALPEVEKEEQRYEHFLHHHHHYVQSTLAQPG